MTDSTRQTPTRREAERPTMNTSTNQAINTIVEFITHQMDGDRPPPSGSADLMALEQAIEAIHEHATELNLQELGLRAVGTVIDRVRSNLKAEQTLRNYLTGGDHA